MKEVQCDEPVGKGKKMVCPKGFMPMQHVTIRKKRMLRSEQNKTQRKGAKNPYRKSAFLWYQDNDTDSDFC